MTVPLTEDTRLLLPHELSVGRWLMMASVLVLLPTVVAGASPLATTVQVAMGVTLALMGAAWCWFWGVLAAGPESWAQAVAVVIITLAACVLVGVGEAGAAPLYFAGIVAGAAFRWRVGLVLVPAASVLAGLVSAQVGDTRSVWRTALITLAFGAVAVTVRRYVAAQVALQHTQEEVRRLATSQARLELARDIHDQLGQELTVSVLQAELLVMDVADASPAIRERAETVLKSTRASLKLMRDTVHESRAPDVDSEIATAVALLAAVGIECTVDKRNTAVSPEVRTVLGWIVRESVTNVLRHSGADHCDITLDVIEGNYVLTVLDDGVFDLDAETLGADTGFGLANMRERLTARGGALDIGPGSGGGFLLVAQLPENS